MAGRAGGIPLQLQDGAGGFLVDTIEACAERALWLLRHPDDAQALAARGRELVRERFLLTRLIADELRLYGSLLGTKPVAAAPVARIGLAGEVRDPVCGMQLAPARAPSIEHQGHRYHFCSETCRQQFTAAPDRFLRAFATASAIEG